MKMEKKKGMKKKVPNVKAAKQAHEAVDNEHAPNEHASDVAKKKVAKNMSDKLISKVEDKFGVKLNKDKMKNTLIVLLGACVLGLIIIQHMANL